MAISQGGKDPHMDNKFIVFIPLDLEEDPGAEKGYKESGLEVKICRPYGVNRLCALCPVGSEEERIKLQRIYNAEDRKRQRDRARKILFATDGSTETRELSFDRLDDDGIELVDDCDVEEIAAHRILLEALQKEYAELTEEKKVIADCVALGYSIREIAGIIGKSKSTTHDKIKSLLKELNSKLSDYNE